MNVIGLGKAGCKIADEFANFPQYTVFKIDSDEKYKRKKNCFHIPQQNSVELYDANPINLDKLVKNLDEDDEVYFITCGSGKISGCALWILREVKHLKVNILYIKPEPNTLDSKGKMRHRAHFHILQEYTRSGVFEKIFLFDNVAISELVGKTSILNYYSALNSFVVNIVHWYNIYQNTEPVFDTFREPYKTSRICTFSVVNPEQESEKATFGLKNINQAKYFYGFNRTTIEGDEGLLEKINRICDKNKDEKVSVSYGIYTVDGKSGLSFSVYSSSDIQLED